MLLEFSLVEELGVDGMTTLPNDENKPIGGDASPTGKNQLETNAENKVGEEKKFTRRTGKWKRRYI